MREPARKSRNRVDLLLLGLAFAWTALALFGSSASAEVTYNGFWGGNGSGNGKFSRPAGIAVNDSTGHVYVVDRNQNRIQEFTSTGTFVRMWGWGVVQKGVDNQTSREVQTLTIRADSGNFKLTFGASTTALVPFNASAAELEAALNAISSINSGGGSVSVTGGPGDASGSNPYVITFDGGPLDSTNVNQLSLNQDTLGIPLGTTLTCTGGPSNVESATYQWLRNGKAVFGATASTYKLKAADEGALIQCQHFAKKESGGATQTSSARLVASEFPETEPPKPPNSINAPTLAGGSFAVPGPESDRTLTCSKGSWTGAEGFTYSWYADGELIGGAEAEEYVIKEGSLSSPTSFQCGVTGTNKAGGATRISGNREVTGSPGLAPTASATVNRPDAANSTVVTTEEGNEVFEVCNAAGNTCGAGKASPGFGGFDKPRGIAVDNSAGGEGDVYVVDDNNYRVEKFSASGELILTFGKDVNISTGGDICDAGVDECGPGTKTQESYPGSFGVWPDNGDFPQLGNEIAVDTSGEVYVGDARQEGIGQRGRIEKFSAGGAFVSQVRVPSGDDDDNPPRPKSLGVNSIGRVFTTLSESGGIEQFDQEELTPEEVVMPLAGRKIFDTDKQPYQLAVSPIDDKIWITDRNFRFYPARICGQKGEEQVQAIVAFESNGHQLDCTELEGSNPRLQEANGIAVSAYSEELYVSSQQNRIRRYKLPERQAPVVVGASTIDVSSVAAYLSVTVNPGFEATDYAIEYGPDDCGIEPESCSTVKGSDHVNGLQDETRKVRLEGLEPDTKYYYRAIAESSVGSDVGAVHTFSTFPSADLTKDECANALARKQTAAAGLSDCRAYELASAAFTGGYDVESDLIPGQTPFAGYPEASGKLLYGIHDGGIPGTGQPTNRGLDQYVATRDPATATWKTKYVGIPANAPSTSPFSSTLAAADSGLGTLAFGGSEICSPCFEDGSTGLPVHRPDGSLVQGMVGSEPVSEPEPAGLIRKPLSGDGTHIVFGSEQQFEPEGNPDNGNVTIYDRDLQKGTTQVVSITAEEEPIEVGDEIAELDISKGGSRIVVATLSGEDEEGNKSWHPYMHIGTNPIAYDLAPGTAGVHYVGMTQDGSKVFFTSRDEFADDSDKSVDLFQADVSNGGEVTIQRLSTGESGEAGQEDSCDPAGNSYNPENWNVIPGGEEDCSVVAIGGDGGLATETGAIYFLSPELLDEKAEEADEESEIEGGPNLYVVPPGSTPHYVTTLESGVSSPVPAPSHNHEHTLAPHTYAEGAAIDPAVGATYVFDTDSTAGSPGAFVKKYDSSGTLDTSFGTGGVINGTEEGNATGEFTGCAACKGEFGFGFPTSIAVDTDPGSPNYRDLYIPDLYTFKVHKYGPNGEYILSIGAEFPTAVGVNPSNGHVYVVGLFGGTTEFNTELEPTGTVFGTEFLSTGVAIDTSGNLYAANPFIGTVIFNSLAEATGVLDPNPSYGVAVDPTDDHVYVDEGNQVIEFNTSYEEVAAAGGGELSESIGLAAYAGHLSVTNAADARTYGPPGTPASRAYDSQLVIQSVRSADTEPRAEFQTSRTGDDAVFRTTLPLTGFDSREKLELYRYHDSSRQIDCVSCSPTEALPSVDPYLPSNGLGLTDDGRVFFNSPDRLVPRDTNEKQDAYEWRDGTQQLVSTGVSPFGSSLLTVTADGKDAFFFTREQLVSEDANGEAVKIYDARELGGNFEIPTAPPCAASDECHGPGTESAPPPQIGTLKGIRGQYSPPAKARKCRKGYSKRKVRGKVRCVKQRGKKGRAKGRRRKERRREARTNRGNT